ncbi:MAG: acetyl/propionyl/methylcrotonyl-CoA carboxylase subunit alpha [Gammaproteobacteria bacterium]
MFESVLVANRGEIARRIMRTARALGVRTVAVHSEVEREALHVREADAAFELGPAPAKDSYLRIDRILEAALRTGAAAVHPGYGFLSEHEDLAAAVLREGLAWVGPAPESIRALGNKYRARELMNAAGVPVNPGGLVESADAAVALAARIGYPVMVKAAAGGGGIGMRIAANAEVLRDACERTRQQAERFFGDGTLILERYLGSARHVEVQILGLCDGTVAALGERECSVQRRYQKVLEETPSPAVDGTLRARMLQAATDGARRLGYRNAGTVECLVAQGEFVFLEVNARLQVEHPITELTTGIDIVAEQLRIAAGDAPGFDPRRIERRGHAIELRVYAEDPVRFLPSPGRIAEWVEPAGEGVRVDSGYGPGDTVTPFYDPLLAKVCVHEADRRDAIRRAARAVADMRVGGIRTNLPFLAEILRDPSFLDGQYDTRLVEHMRAAN